MCQIPFMKADWDACRDVRGKAPSVFPVLVKNTWCVVTRHESFFVDALKRLALGNESEGTIC